MKLFTIVLGLILLVGIAGRCETPVRPVLKNRQYELIGHSINTTDEINIDAWEANGTVGRSTEDRVFVFDPGLMERPAIRILLHPISINKKALLSSKFRYGFFYRRFNNKIQRFNPSLGDWLPIFESPVEFAQFDITEDGRILLINTGRPEHRKIHPLQRGQEDYPPDTSYLIEIYQPGQEIPDKKIEFPKEIIKIHELVHGVWPVDKVWNIRDTLLLWQQSTGILYRYDAQADRLDLPDVPWHNLLNTYFPEGRPKYPAMARKGRSKIDIFSFPFFPQVYPAGNGRVVLAMRFDYRKKNQVYHLHGISADEEYLPFPSDLICEEIPDQSERVGAFFWDLQEGGLKRLRLQPTPGRDFGPASIWIEPNGSWRLFAELIKTLDPPRPAPVGKGSEPSKAVGNDGGKASRQTVQKKPTPAFPAHQ